MLCADKVSLWGGYPPVPNQTDFPRLHSDSWKAELIYDFPKYPKSLYVTLGARSANDASLICARFLFVALLCWKKSCSEWPLLNRYRRQHRNDTNKDLRPSASPNP